MFSDIVGNLIRCVRGLGVEGNKNELYVVK